MTQTSSDVSKVSNNYQRSAMDPNSGQASTIQFSGAQTGENLTGEVSSTGALQSNYTSSVASADAQSPGGHASLAANTAISANIPISQNSGLPAPAQVVVENTPVGSGRLLRNWSEFWRALALIINNCADLIKNERTKQELREAVQAEVHKLDVEKEGT